MGVITIQRAKKDVGQIKIIKIGYVLPFKTMAIMASFIFIHMNVKEFKPKIHLMKF
jgi:hypothetical protein